MGLRNLTFVLVLTAAAVPCAAGAGEEDPATRDAKAAVAYFDKYAGKAKDDMKFGDLLMDLTRIRHTITVERIGKVLLRDSNVEHQQIAGAALGGFREPKEVRDAAGKLLEKAVQDAKDDDVKDTCIDSIGKIRYRDAVPTLNQVALAGGNPYVLYTTVRVMGQLEDRRALPALLELWERHPVGYSWETGEVNVDTGAEGTADQDAAEAEWQAKYGSSMGPKKKPPVMLKVYIQELVRSVEKITKEKIAKPDQLRAWMEARREELKKEGVDIPKYKGPSKKQKEKDEKEKDEKDGKKEKDDKK